MNRVLLAWELGSNYGHLARLRAVAGHLRAQGHAVFFAVRDTRTAAVWLDPEGLEFTQAPLPVQALPLRHPPANYSELLLADAYADRPGLWGRVRSWAALFRLFRADTVVADHAPTALLAAHMTGLPCVAVGHGFALPPDRYPLPSIRPWETIADERLRQADEAVLKQINAVCRQFHARPLAGIPDLFSGAARVWTTFPELDHYGERNDAYYVGPIFTRSAGRELTWPGSGGPRIFAYLRPGPGISSLLKALSRCDATVIIACPGIGRREAQALAHRHCIVSSQPVRLVGLLNSADLAVSYGSLGTVAACMLAGVPLLLAPLYVEQYLMSLRVEALGAGRIAQPSSNERDLANLLEAMPSDAACRRQARAFAERHAGFAPAQAVERVVRVVEDVLQGRAAPPDEGQTDGPAPSERMVLNPAVGPKLNARNPLSPARIPE